MAPATLSVDRIRRLLVEYDPAPAEELLLQLSAYLDLLVRWNARTNLTAIRDPEEMVRRHFGESLFVARHLPACTTLLDLGSGAGFPGIPIQLALPALQVTLAESQRKKTAFLREAVRRLDLPTTVWGERAELLRYTNGFDVVAMRAVDNPVLALELAFGLVNVGGYVAHLTTDAEMSSEGVRIPMPGSRGGVLQLIQMG